MLYIEVAKPLYKACGLRGLICRNCYDSRPWCKLKAAEGLAKGLIGFAYEAFICQNFIRAKGTLRAIITTHPSEYGGTDHYI